MPFLKGGLFKTSLCHFGSQAKYSCCNFHRPCSLLRHKKVAGCCSTLLWFFHQYFRQCLVLKPILNEERPKKYQHDVGVEGVLILLLLTKSCFLLMYCFCIRVVESFTCYILTSGVNIFVFHRSIFTKKLPLKTETA